MSLLLYLAFTFLAPGSIQDTPSKLGLKGDAAREYCRAKGFNTSYCFLVNMGKHSGLKRFYIWDFKQHLATDSGLVSHGCGNAPWSGDETKTNPVFSNTPDSHCSSLGKYKIGKRGYSNWGIHVNYKLHGLDATNSNAYKRIIVLHSWEAVTEEEVFPHGTPEGWGCPAVSNKFMEKLDSLIQSSHKPILLWMYS